MVIVCHSYIYPIDIATNRALKMHEYYSTCYCLYIPLSCKISIPWSRLGLRVFGWALSSPGFDDDFSNSRLIATISWWFSPKISAIEAHRDLTTLSSVSFLNDMSRDKAADPTYDAKWSGVDDPYETVGLNSPRPLSAEGS